VINSALSVPVLFPLSLFRKFLKPGCNMMATAEGPTHTVKNLTNWYRRGAVAGPENFRHGLINEVTTLDNCSCPNFQSVAIPGDYPTGVDCVEMRRCPSLAWSLALVFGLSFAVAGSLAQTAGRGPQPPCGNEANPSYPALSDPPQVKFWRQADLGLTWKAPACTGWTEQGFTTLVTTSARFSYSAESPALLRRIGAISERAGMRYWSTTHQRWQTLIVDAHVLTGAQHSQRRQDFTPDEMKVGEALYFEQVDNLTGKATYRMQIVEESANRIVFTVENVSTIHYLFIPVLRPGEMQSIYFLNRESERVWLYYGIVRTGKNANKRVAGNESSSINRAVAFYRFVVGIPTDQEPPAAR
jgi:hypothetical protein